MLANGDTVRSLACQERDLPVESACERPGASEIGREWIDRDIMRARDSRRQIGVRGDVTVDGCEPAPVDREVDRTAEPRVGERPASGVELEEAECELRCLNQQRRRRAALPGGAEARVERPACGERRLAEDIGGVVGGAVLDPADRPPRAVVDVVDDPLEAVRARSVVVRIPFEHGEVALPFHLQVVRPGGGNRVLDAAVDDRGPDRHGGEERHREARGEVPGGRDEPDAERVAVHDDPGDVRRLAVMEGTRADDVAEEGVPGCLSAQPGCQRALDRVLERLGGDALAGRR